jgi:hypothetical protein
MPSPAKRIADDLDRHAAGLSRYVGRIELELRRGSLNKGDVHRAYAGAFVYFYLHLEGAIEDLFMGFLMNRLSPSRGQVRPLVTIKSEVVARNVVRGDRAFVDWLPYKRTRDRAVVLLSQGRPFVSLTAQQVAILERDRVIRNAIAHAQGNAMHQFQRQCLTGLALPSDQRRPPGFLRGQHAFGQTRFDYLVAQSVAAIRQLA